MQISTASDSKGPLSLLTGASATVVGGVSVEPGELGSVLELDIVACLFATEVSCWVGAALLIVLTGGSLFDESCEGVAVPLTAAAQERAGVFLKADILISVFVVLLNTTSGSFCLEIEYSVSY